MQAAAWFAIETELRNKNCIFNENHLRNERVLIIWISVLSEHVYIFFIASTFRVNDCYATIRSVNNNDEKILKWFCEEKMHGLLTCRVSVISILFFFLSLKCKTQINANIHSERGIVFVFFLRFRMRYVFFITMYYVIWRFTNASISIGFLFSIFSSHVELTFPFEKISITFTFACSVCSIANSLYGEQYLSYIGNMQNNAMKWPIYFWYI